MTAPHLRTRSLLKTMRFLDELTRPGDTPRVPKHIRDTARRLMRDYPGFDEIEAAHKALPDVFGPVKQRQAEGEVQAVDLRRLPSRDSWFDPLAGAQLYRICEDDDPELPDANKGVLLG